MSRDNRIELVYFPGCPHVGAAREALSAALRAEALPLSWREWNRDDASTPERLRGYGSPTVLVDGHDVAPTAADGACCRVYAGSDGLHAAPAVELIRKALRSETGKQ